MLTVAMLACASPASARGNTPAVPEVGVPLVPATSSSQVPPGFRIDAARALAVAKTSPTMREIHNRLHPLRYRVYFWLGSHYEVFFSHRGKLVGDVLVGPGGRLWQTYTGPLILGIYARGKYGDVFDSPWVFVPFTLMFLLPLVRLRGCSWLDLLDVGAVLTFFVSYGLFDHGHLELAVWLAYPPLLYLMCRMLIRGLRQRSPARRLQVALSTRVLVAGLIALIAGRIAVALIPAHVMDVAVASLIGASKILHGQSLYFASLGHPDTYGPVAYLAYVPFELIWSGVSWGYDPAARAAAITFDLITIGALVALGTRLRAGTEGRRLGLLMGWMWAACPFTVLGMVKSTNDGLVAMLLVLVILAINSPIRRGALLGLAAAAKFIPAILLPLMAVGHRDGERQGVVKALAGFVLAAGGTIVLFLPPGGIKEMYDHTIGFQLSRADIFSIWALHPGFAPLKIAVEVGVAGLALAVAARPRVQRSTVEVSALAAALVIAVQLPAVHWFYLYIVWFMPLVLVAVLAAEPSGAEPAPAFKASELPAPIERDPAGALVGAG